MASVKPSVALALLVCCATAVGALPTGCTYGSTDSTATCTEFSYLSKLPDTVTHLTLQSNSLTNVPVGSLDELLRRPKFTKLTIEMNLTCDCNTMYLKRLAQDNLEIIGANCKYLGGQEVREMKNLTGNEFPDVCATAPPHCSEMLLRDSGLHIAYLVFLVPLVYSYLGLRPLVSHRRDGHYKGGNAAYKRISDKSSSARSARSAPSAPPEEKIYEDVETKL